MRDGATGLGIATFISTPTVPNNSFVNLFGVGLGNDRGPDPNGGGYKTQTLITFDPNALPSIQVTSTPGPSTVVFLNTQVVTQQGYFTGKSTDANVDANGNAQISITLSAANGFADMPGASIFAPSTSTINVSISLTITPDGLVTVNPGSTYSGYPSLEIWTYNQDQPSQVLSAQEGSISTLGTWGTPIPAVVVNPDTGGGGGGGTTVMPRNDDWSDDDN